MLTITALIHTENDVRRLGRALETLYPCDDILIVDHDSRDGTVQVAREYGARVVKAEPGATPDHYSRMARSGWILCLDSHESLTEGLAASLFELKSGLSASPGDIQPEAAFSVFLREETAQGWIEVPTAQTRLVTQTYGVWADRFPVHAPYSVTLKGEVLRFAFP